MFNRIWKNVSNWKVKVLEGFTDANLVGISFQSKQDAQWVLDKQHWVFNGGFLILEEWPRSGNWQDAKLDKVFSWVRIRGFPLKFRESDGFGGLRSSLKGKEVVQEVDVVDTGGGFAHGKVDKAHGSSGVVLINGDDSPLRIRLVGCIGGKMVRVQSTNRQWRVVILLVQLRGMGSWIQDDINIRVDSSSPGHIASVVTGEGFQPWYLTCFYGHPDKQQRIFSWELLQNIAGLSAAPWLCIGDFNEIVSFSEIVGGPMKCPRSMEDFQEVMDNCQLSDFCSCKSELTWGNGHRDMGVMERLDRALCNEEWLSMFDGADVKVLDWWESDHRALVVNLPIGAVAGRSISKSRRSRFHFEEAWCEEDECKEIVDSVWEREGGTCSASGFKKKSASVE
ncbi:hypothetical protein F8388_002342 [Cannabis sativa]|uniref:DUF4283 domain-containing protein n=1 Tax=Cannabis sativa TaxID=3483 RepID=A0A7J6EFC7_CANSA|nr:hypothetical protein F8388_002342 [Cannabis sativa]KAF4391929.1 hypothetical protein G4B88_007504 [Cannabis sativa]